MNTKKLALGTNIYCIPPMIINSLQLAKNNVTQSNHSFKPSSPSHLATNLIKSYCQKGLIKEARTLFDEMPVRDVVAWTAMISGYTDTHYHTNAWSLFFDMLKSDVVPNEYTLSNVLKACKAMNYVAYGGLVHGLVMKLGFQKSIFIENALLDMYASCCVDMENACLVFGDIERKNAVSWTAMIAGYTHRGDGHNALRVFREMLLEKEELNPYSVSIAVRACASIGYLDSGKQIHAAVTKSGLEFNLPVMNSIIDMYCRCDCLSEAYLCFNEMPEKDLITWNTLISGYERSDPSESLHIYSKMESEGFCPNCFTFTSVMAACSNLAVLNCGQQIHGGIIRRGLDKNLALSNSLIDMYAKCGNIADSCKIFRELTDRNLVTWTSMMIAYGAHGNGVEAVELFDEMVRSGIIPDRIVFMAVLSACSHAGLVDQGLSYFSSMVGYYNIAPDQETYGCVVDLLGRAGRVEEAYQLILNMPFKPDESVWGALLGACKAHRLSNLGKLAARKVLDLTHLRPNKIGAYVMLSNIYAAEGKWVESAKMRKLIRKMGNKKEAGLSWIQVKDDVHSFVVGDKMHPHIEMVYKVSELLIWNMKKGDDVIELDCVIHDLDEGT
ncbi:hypothetical protein ACFE04_028949 [Oxalis oulophora]